MSASWCISLSSFASKLVQRSHLAHVVLLVVGAVMMQRKFQDIVRVTIHGSLTGAQYCFPGPANAENGWTVPGNIFQVENVVGCYLVYLTYDADGNKIIKKNDDGTPVLSEEKVAAVLRGDVVADRKMYLELAADDNSCVFVTFGETVMPYEGVPEADAPTIECANLDSVFTPSTPPGSVSSS